MEDKIGAEKNNAKMAEDLLKVIHRFDGGPVPLDDAIQQASLVYKQLELQLNKAQDKNEKKEIGEDLDDANTPNFIGLMWIL